MDKEQILYEDQDIIVCHKPAGIATQTARIAERDMVSEVTNYLAVSAGEKNGTRPYVGVVHRLDQPVEGILVYAKNQKAAAVFSRQISEAKTEKYYFAVISDDRFSGETGTRQSGTLVDYLLKDGRTNTSMVVPKEQKGAKRAELSYEIQSRRADEKIALAKIKLITGRHHQIRVQMSHAGMSLLGDYKYADEQTKKLSEQMQQKQVALCAYKIAFAHPVTGKRMSFQRQPEGQIFQRFL